MAVKLVMTDEQVKEFNCHNISLLINILMVLLYFTIFI